ncbi:DUF2851 family protein [Pseudotenacibaculum sp. MALMAid0570]|uniref:DUF2851 family protein n=1 Tax=Pseudotenacibaculum sp. MALMAid0570 TaxID=3143938 RepID=UPI0032E02537
MKEDFLHYVWNYQLLDSSRLKTTCQQSLSVIHTGIYNSDSGPDFSCGRIRIENQLWIGNIEIHLKSSDWYFHNHETDDNYDSVILHVVWSHDVDVFMKNNKPLPTLELKSIVTPSVLKNYQQLQGRNVSWIPCEKQLKDIDEFTLSHWLECLYIERLEKKSTNILKLLKQTKNDWEAVLFVLIAKSFGLNKNGDAFMQMASSIPFSIVRKEAYDQTRFEALLFGQAGFLEKEFNESYGRKLKEEYQYIKHKYNLNPMPENQFLFFRMRPSNFPTIRIAQLSVLYTKNRDLFSKIMNCKSIKEVYNLFEIEVDEFWKNHYTFSKESKRSLKRLTKNFIDLIIINTIIPLKFCYLKSIQQLNEEELIAMVRLLKPEKNGIIEKFSELKIEAKNAFETQALLELKNNYCAKKRCLQCAIGNKLVRN